MFRKASNENLDCDLSHFFALTPRNIQVGEGDMIRQYSVINETQSQFGKNCLSIWALYLKLNLQTQKNHLKDKKIISR